MIFLMSCSIAQGPVAGVATAAGVSVGLVFAGLTFLIKGPVGLGVGLLSGWLGDHPKALLWIYRSSGAVLLGLGIKLAFERQP